MQTNFSLPLSGTGLPGKNTKLYAVGCCLCCTWSMGIPHCEMRYVATSIGPGASEQKAQGLLKPVAACWLLITLSH